MSQDTLNDFTDYCTNYQLEIEVVSSESQNQIIYLKQLINVNVIDGLEYEEDGLIFSRKTSKDN
ncbi:hypothetical protein IJQ19_03690 [bacterium]|nr:hypothetical protein [bacterium]